MMVTLYAQIQMNLWPEADPMKRMLVISAVFFLFQACSAQQDEEPQHKFLNWRNITIMSTAAGGHVWATKEYNGPGYTATEVAIW
jgi:hypothetical protein